MSIRSISSPGIEINEVDLSILARPVNGNNTFACGFAPQGPTDEIINVGSVTEYEAIFGLPTNSAERYLYHTCKQVLTQSSANLMVTRMPYGSGAGEGFSNQYTALVYPISSNDEKYETSTEFKVLAPYSILLSDEQYDKLSRNDVSWGDSYSDVDIESFDDLEDYGGLVVVDINKSSTNNLFEGYYVGLADNSENNPATDFTAISNVKSVNSISDTYQNFGVIPSGRLNFKLTQDASDSGNSVSRIMETFPRDYDFGAKTYNDSLTLMVFKLRTSVYASDNVLLDYSISEGYTGSLNSSRKQNDKYGGPSKTFFLDEVSRSSPNIKVMTNPNISKKGTWVDTDGLPSRTVRLDNQAKSLFSQGVYSAGIDKNSKDVGNIPLKLQRILNNIDNLDLDLDVTIEAGLGTIWVGSKTRWEDPNHGSSNIDNPYNFDEAYNPNISVLKTQTGDPVGGVSSDYLDVANQFASFATETRKDHVFIADPLRFIFIQGSDSKVSRRKDYVFSRDIYWPLKNLYGSIASSYAATYGNWLKTNDSASDKQVWIPASGHVATVFANSSQANFPWSAPAGFNRGALTNVTDLAVNPTQKQRDILYKISVNPIAFFPGDGFVLYGQKTLFSKPSAFDRINVRRLFLFLEKTSKQVLKYFIFEPNTFTTRTRVSNALTNVFDQAKNNDGVYDYRIVCDERNNTPDVIDNNELRLSIYIQPVRTAEFILADFIATRTGIDFSELIG